MARKIYDPVEEKIAKKKMDRSRTADRLRALNLESLTVKQVNHLLYDAETFIALNNHEANASAKPWKAA